MRIILFAALAAGTFSVTGCNRSGTVNDPISVSPSVAPRYNSRHYSWCARQYTTYRRSTNTYTTGPGLGRRRCVSPYI